MDKSEKRREIKRQREIDNLCVYCGIDTPVSDKKGCKNCLDKKSKSTSKYVKENKDKTSQYRLLTKHIVIEKYGGECNCCGEKQILFLTIDHKNNDGNLERKKEKISTFSFYLKLKKEEIREDLQVLCWNCNLGKSINNGICPHQEIKRTLDPIYDNRHIPQFDTRLKILWPDDEDLIKMCNEKSISQVSKELGVDFTAVSNRLKRRNKYHLVNKKKGGIFTGEDNKSSKLTKQQVNEIREKNYKNKTSRKELSEEYNVSLSLIDKIVTYKVWKS